jgi:hypothetical protein
MNKMNDLPRKVQIKKLFHILGYLCAGLQHWQRREWTSPVSKEMLRTEKREIKAHKRAIKKAVKQLKKLLKHG